MLKRFTALFLAGCLLCSSLSVFAQEPQTSETAATPSPAPTSTTQPAGESSTLSSPESTALAAPSQQSRSGTGEYTYSVNEDNTITITGYTTEPTGDVTLPSQIDGKTVTAIGDSAFEACESLTSIVISDSVTSIGATAFSDCVNLGSVTIPRTVKSIGANAFYYCISLSSITIPDSVTSIGAGAFSNCRALTSVVIPNSIKSIEGATFSNCVSLTEVVIPDSVESIGEYAFMSCPLTSVTIPKSVTAIGERALFECSSLATINYTGTKAEWVSVSIGTDAITDNVTIICSDGTIEKSPFTYSENGDDTITITGYSGELSGDVTLPSEIDGKTVTSIGDKAFSGYDSLTSVVIPNSVTSIGDGAFYSCDSLANVTIPDSVTSMDMSVFAHCAALTSVTIPNSITRINFETFYNCDSLTSVTLPNSIKGIVNEAFYNCDALKKVTYNGTKAQWREVYLEGKAFDGGVTVVCTDGDFAEQTFYFSENEDGTLTVTGGNFLKGDIVIPSEHDGKKVTGIEFSAFEGCDSLTSVTIPDSITSIGTHAFSGASLTSVTIPDSLTSINDGIFSGCNSLTSVTIPDSVTSIGNYAFESCDSLTNITIPASVTSIGSYVFAYCDSLASITIPASVTEIGYSAFYNTALQTVNFTGTRSQWEAVKIGADNTALDRATVYYVDDDQAPEAPVLDSPVSVENGVQLTWSAPEGANGYRVYRKAIVNSASSAWKLIANSSQAVATPESASPESATPESATPESATPESAGSSQIVGTTCLDTNVREGGRYYYKVVAYKGKVPSAYSNETRITLTTAPVMNDPELTDEGAVLSWSASKNAESYQLYRKADGENAYSLLVEQKELSYLDKTIEEGKRYTYRVKAKYGMEGDEEIQSAYSDVVAVDLTLEKELSSVEVKTAPAKVTYIEGESFVPAGLVLTLTYDNGETKDVAYTAANADDFTFSPALTAKLATTNKSVTITYGGKTTTQAITVNEKSLTSIKVKTAPTKTEYIEGNTFAPAGLALTLTHDNGDTEDVTYTAANAEDFTFSPALTAKLATTNKSVTITYGGKTATQAITVNEKSLTSIEVKAAPTKTAYIEGNSFAPAGLALTLTYDNGDAEDVTYSAANAEDFTFSPALTAKLTTTDKSVTITYGGKSTTQAITVKEKSLTSVKIKTAPTKTEYIEGNTFAPTGLVLTLTYDNGDAEDVIYTAANAEDFTFSPALTAKLATTNKSMTITYGGKTTTQAITVNEKSLTSIEVKTAPTKVTYIEGNNFDPAGLVLTLTYDNGDTEDVTYTAANAESFTFSPALTAKLATTNKSVTITYGGKTATQAITVNEKSLTDISVKTAPTKTEYIEGNTFAPAGLALTLTYDNGETKDVTYTAANAEDFTFSPALTAKLATTNKSVTITYGGKTATQAITVNEKSLTSIAVKTAPAKIAYTESSCFDPAGLAITLTYDNGDTEAVTYGEATKADFTFAPALTAELAATDKTVTITYGGKSAEQAITVNKVVELPEPEVDDPDADTEYQLKAEVGLSEVPEALKDDEKLNTTQGIVEELELEVEQQIKTEIDSDSASETVIEETTIKILDVKLLVSTDGGETWTEATKENFPENGITFVLPYSELGLTYEQVHTLRLNVIHMITTGEKAGQTEKLIPTLLPGGLQVTTYSLSPIAVAYAPKPVVTFDANGGSCPAVPTYTGNDNRLSGLPKATRDGYTFDGWFTEADGGTRITLDTVYAADTTVYAHWTKVSASTPSSSPSSSPSQSPSASPSSSPAATHHSSSDDDDDDDDQPTATATAAPAAVQASNSSHTPNTGDASSMATLYALLALTVCGLLGLGAYKRKMNK